jgi:hypothetical protein
LHDLCRGEWLIWNIVVYHRYTIVCFGNMFHMRK